MTMQKKMLKTAAAACAAALAAVLLAGCGDETSKKTYSPVPFTKHDRCHLCGMVLAQYEGPKAQLIIKGAEDTPLMFCSGRDAFTYALQPENQRRLLAFFIHDLGKTSWETPAADALVPAASAMYVYGHGREGVMGDEPVAFTEKSRADAFIAKWGGQVYKYEEITLKRLD